MNFWNSQNKVQILLSIVFKYSISKVHFQVELLDYIFSVLFNQSRTVSVKINCNTNVDFDGMNQLGVAYLP